jgi:CheY-like chemotaxis protein
MTRHLFLDDDENRHRRYARENIGTVVDHVRSADEAITMLRAHSPYDVASLDHDLDPEATLGRAPRCPTGMKVAEFIAAMPELLRPRRVIVHSFNPRARPKMVRLLRAAGVPAEERPFAPASSFG